MGFFKGRREDFKAGRAPDEAGADSPRAAAHSRTDPLAAEIGSSNAPRGESTEPSRDTGQDQQKKLDDAVPGAVDQRWLDEHLPSMSSDEITAVMKELERRGWSTAALTFKVIPHLLPKLNDAERERIVSGLREGGMGDSDLALLTPELAFEGGGGLIEDLYRGTRERLAEKTEAQRVADSSVRPISYRESDLLRIRQGKAEDEERADWAFVQLDRTGNEVGVIAACSSQELSELLSNQLESPQHLGQFERTDPREMLQTLERTLDGPTDAEEPVAGETQIKERIYWWLWGGRFFVVNRDTFDIEDDEEEALMAESPSNPAPLKDFAKNYLPAPRTHLERVISWTADDGPHGSFKPEGVVASIEARLATADDPLAAREEIREIVERNRDLIGPQAYRLYLTALGDQKRGREPIPERVRNEVWRRDQGRCVDCGSRERLELDHIIPHSRGGSNTARNLQLLCEPCNRKKSARI